MFDLTRLNRYLPECAHVDYTANGIVNSYAPVTAVDNTSITIDRNNIIEGSFVQFTVGAEIFVHVSGSRDGSKAFLGCWTFAEITNVVDNTLTLDRDITADIPARLLNNYYIQALTVPFFYARPYENPVQNTLSPPAFDVNKMCGGIIVVKAPYLYMGSSVTPDYGINLKDKGIPTTHKSLRPWFEYEKQGMLDTDPYAGWENAMLEHRLPLNVGDGAALLYTASGGSFSYLRVVGNIAGVQYCRGASDSPNLPANATNIGGSTILMIGRGRANDIKIYWAGKYRSTTSELGQGLGACMFVTASRTALNCNEGGLYAHTNFHQSNLPANLKIANVFGNGSFGNCSGSKATKQMNNYAFVTTTSTKATFNTKKISYARKTRSGLAPIEKGALVMIHVVNTVTWHTVDTIICNVLSDDGYAITVDKNVNLGANRQAMIVSIPQFKNFTLSTYNYELPKYSDGLGGIFAIAVSDTCDISGGKIWGTAKGGVPLNTDNISLIERPDVLTLGPGGGSIFILAKNIIMNTDTRLGMVSYKNPGSRLGGRGANGSVNNGIFTASPVAKGGGYRGGSVEDSSNTGGFGGGGGSGKHVGGFLGNGTYDADITNAGTFGSMGSNLLIIADKITNFNISAISTGGVGFAGDWYQGGAGYGGGGGGNGAGGGFRGGGAGDFAAGGSAGYAFIYCNDAVNQITDGIILDE